VLAGEIATRAVRITLKIAARQGETDRDVLRVALRSERMIVERADLSIDDGLLVQMTRTSPSIGVDQHRWLRLGFRHLGKLDMLRVLEGMLHTAERLDDLVAV
jgi:hypothetical protein